MNSPLGTDIYSPFLILVKKKKKKVQERQLKIILKYRYTMFSTVSWATMLASVKKRKKKENLTYLAWLGEPTAFSSICSQIIRSCGFDASMTSLTLGYQLVICPSSSLHSSLRTKLIYNFSQCPGICNPKQETGIYLLQLRRSLTSSSYTWSLKSLSPIQCLNLIVYSYPFPRKIYVYIGTLRIQIREAEFVQFEVVFLSKK